MARILVTGAAGFIGSALCRGLAERGHRPIAGLRSPVPPPSTAEGLLLGDITPDRDWSRALRGIGIGSGRVSLRAEMRRIDVRRAAC